MDKPVNVLGVIHARGGSKRIPMKNIKPLGGKPLIAWVIEAALGTETLEGVIVSTDHPEIKNVALEYGAEVPFDRPKEISNDCPSEYVTQHAVRFVEEHQGKEIQIAVSMQPTTPFCLPSDIDACVKMLQAHPEWDSVFTGCIARERPEWMFHYEGDGTAKLFQGAKLKGNTGVIQTLPPLAVPNGAAYATRRRAIFEDGLLISTRTGILLMPLERSVDIDESLDFAFAEFMVKTEEE